MIQEEFKQRVAEMGARWIQTARFFREHPEMKGWEKYNQLKESTDNLFENCITMKLRAICKSFDQAAIELATVLELHHHAEPLFDPLNIKNLH